MNRDLLSGMCKFRGILLQFTMTYSVYSNLMVDTFIANASPEEYEIPCILHIHALIFISQPSLHLSQLLATGPPGIAPAFLSAARSRLRQTNKPPAQPLRPLPTTDSR